MLRVSIFAKMVHTAEACIWLAVFLIFFAFVQRSYIEWGGECVSHSVQRKALHYFGMIYTSQLVDLHAAPRPA